MDQAGRVRVVEVDQAGRARAKAVNVDRADQARAKVADRVAVDRVAVDRVAVDRVQIRVDQHASKRYLRQQGDHVASERVDAQGR